MSAGFRSLEDALHDMLARSPLREGLLQQDVLASWGAIVGTEIARHSQPLALRDGVLLVRVDGSAWAQELTLLVPRICEEFEKKLGKGSIKDVRFHTGSKTKAV
jgi:predicted nucleic acid-binding Zn ribbon protein